MGTCAWGRLINILAIQVIETKGAIKNGQSRETGNIEHTRHKTKTNKTKHNMSWTPLYANNHK